MPLTGVRLTIRGVIFLLCGVGAALAAAWFGEPDLVWLGVFLIALPVIGLLLVLLTQPRLTVEREVSPSQAPIGESPRATLRIRNKLPTALSTLEFQDTIPRELGSDARFNLTRGFGRWDQVAGYDVPATRRGLFQLGPLRVRAFDPFGTAVLTWKVRGDSTSIRVTPKIWQVERMGSGISSGSAGDSTPQRIGQAGQDDVLVREHRHGDDMRRVHWRMSAKMDELMVRLEEHPWDPALTMVIDNRSSAHFGEGPSSTLEWGISAGASVAANLLTNRHRVTILSADDLVYTPPHTDATANKEVMVHALTDMTASSREDLDTGLSDWDALSSSHTLLGILGILTPQDAAVLAAIGVHMIHALALVPDAAAWGVTQKQYDDHRDALRLLTSTGWDIQRYRPGDKVPEAWKSLMSRSRVS